MGGSELPDSDLSGVRRFRDAGGGCGRGCEEEARAGLSVRHRGVYREDRSQHRA